MKIIKRDGKKEPFDSQKIMDAVLKAFLAVDGTITEYAEIKAYNIAEHIEKIAETTSLTIDNIQDYVEKGLMATKRKDVAKAYILYRKQRDIAREKNTDIYKEAANKLFAKNVQNQNANVDEYSFGGRMGEFSETYLKKYALENCMSEMARNNHLNNEIYIHDLGSYAAGMHNCCARETKFCTTYNGVRSFLDYEDGDRVSVLTPYAVHKMATVHKYGIQKLNKITFSFAGKRFVTERFTSNHRWILADGTETINLKIGDKLKKAPIIIRTQEEFSFDDATDKEKYYWCLGFVLADGTEAYRWSHGKKCEDVKFVRMRLCGDKIKYESRFANLKHSTKEMENGDLYLTFSSTIGFRKIFPDLNQMTRREKHALFDGLYAADGQHSGSRKSILTTNKQIAKFIEDEAPALGWFILNINDKTDETTNYKTHDFTREYTFISDANKYYWTVVDIQEDKEEEVWCLDVEDLHSFVLPNGITTGNCLSIPFDKLLAKGVVTRQTDVRPAGSVMTAFQLIAVYKQLQSLQQFGGVSATHLDWTMVPYVRKSFIKHWKDGLVWVEESTDEVVDALANENKYYEKYSIEDEIFSRFGKAYTYAKQKTIRETEQAVESMYHNLNTLQSRSGNQLPFTSINYGTCTLPEGRMVIKALLEGSIKGVGKYHKTSIFPCGIFQCMKGVNRAPGDPNYDLFLLALESTSKRLYPNYANVDWSGNEGYDRNDPCTYFSTMGCRTANGWDINGMGQRKDGRGNICPVTIIMPTIAMKAKELVDELNKDGECETYEDVFMEMLDTKIKEAKDMLIERFEWICSQSPESAKFMYENGLMEGYIPEEGIRSALKHGTLAIGQLGLAETLEILIGCDHTTPKGMKLAKKIEQLFKDRCAQYKEEYRLNFGVYYTPAENLCYTAMTKFKAKYGDIFKRDYFTNSMHVPVWKNISPFDKIDIESQLTGYSSAGCITYVELDGGVQHNLKALEELVNYAMDKDIPYFAINVPNDTCLNCGYTGEFNDECPMCKSKNIQHLRRVTGYLTGDYKKAFNYGKQKETEDRVNHTRIFKDLGPFKYNANDVVNGNGFSVSVFFKGCPHRCPGCFNAEIWGFVQDEITDEHVEIIYKALTANGIKRNLSLLGGEPLCEENLDKTLYLIEKIHKLDPTIKVICWTGYELEDLDRKNKKIKRLFKNIDILIDGPYIEAERDISLKLRGSRNQKILKRGFDF